MSYTVNIYNPKNLYSSHEVGGAQEARDQAAEFIADRMDAFGEDREALRQYGWLKVEAEALDMSDDGGTILLPDGWRIEIINNKDES